MTRDELIDRCKAVIQEAYEEATEMVVAYLELNPDEPRERLCKEIDQENWSALDARVRRRQKARKSTNQADLEPTRTESRVRHGRSALRDPDIRQRILNDLTPSERAELIRQAAPPPPQHVGEKMQTDKTFIELIVRINSALIELEGLVGGWQNTAAVPAEFSRESFNDIVAKALRIQDRFDQLLDALHDEDEQRFQEIVQNFRVVDDVR